MFKYFIAIGSIFFCSVVQSQSTKGLTGKRDTSYSNYNAYVQTKKSHPDIELVHEMKSSAIKEKRNITYCTNGDRSLQLDAFSPKKKSKVKRPAIIIIHGGGWRTGNRAQHYPLAQKLSTLGYVCFTPEYRLSTEALYPAAVLDIKAALRWVRANAAQFNIDTAKIVVAGFSAGGELAAFIGSTNGVEKFEGNNCNTNVSSSVAAIVDMDGTLSFVHPESGEGDDSKSTSAATYWFGWGKAENPELWQEASPLAHVGKNTPPILFINSSVDRMHAGREDFIAVLNQHGIYSEVHSFPEAPHSFPLFHPWFEPTVNYIDNFLKKVFKPK